MGRSKLFAVSAGFLLMVSLLTGCPSTPPPPLPPPVQVTALKVGLMLDKSGSANSTRTAQPSVEDIQPIIDKTREVGGEFAVGLISDDSNRPLIRLRIDPPPVEPVKPNDVGDADQIATEYDKYNKDQKVYEKQAKAWEQETEKRINKFVSEIEPILRLKANARRSDVLNALNRVDLYLGEKDPVFSTNIRKVIILNSDAQDNVKAKLNTLNSGARLIVVNGIGSVGSLKALNPELFESLKSAVNHIVKGG